MTSRNIDPIIRPCTEELPLEPSVGIGEKITRAIELMVSHNLNRIAVVRNRRAIGVIRLEDAFQEIGRKSGWTCLQNEIALAWLTRRAAVFGSLHACQMFPPVPSCHPEGYTFSGMTPRFCLAAGNPF
jgi:hypothetical protein